MDVKIRAMVRDDLHSVYDILLATLSETYITHYEIQHGMAEDEKTISPKAQEILKRYLFGAVGQSLDYSFVGEANGQIISFAICFPRTIKEKRMAELMDLVVRREFRRKGIGTRLLEEFHERLLSKGVSEVYCAVNPRNEAITLYKRFGYKPVSLVMRKELAR